MATNRVERSRKRSSRQGGSLLKEGFREIGGAFAHGDWKTRMSFLIMGFGNFSRKQFIKGLLYFALEIVYIAFFVNFGWTYLRDFGTLGTNTFERVWDEAQQIYINAPGDNSMLILLFSVMTLFITAGFLYLYFQNVRAAYRAQKLVETGKKLPGFRDDLRSLLDERFHTTLLTLPALGVLALTVMPLVFMILMAFTNFDRKHQPPGNLFTWIGLENFKDVFWQNPMKSQTFYSLLGWTLIWAVFATFTCFIFGTILAMMINKKGIRLKSMWRTIFVTTVAVPSFVTLLLMSKALHDLGPVNVLLQNWGLISEPIHFLTDGTLAKITVICVNMWIGIPYTMLAVSGVLMNIPADLYESARIDGAGPVVQFTKITLPYLMFVMGPYLITQFINNINNFNVIYFLTAGDPKSLNYFQAGETDLLVTWLYKLTVNYQDYNLASTIGILVFVVCAVFSLITFNLTASSKKEETFS